MRTFVRGEAVIAVFHNGTPVIPDNTFPISVPDRYDGDGDEGKPDTNRPLDPSKSLHIKSKGVEKLVVQYKLRTHGSQDWRVLEYLDVDMFLKGDCFGNWCWQQNDKFNPILRRHLEHILCVCLVNVVSKSDQQLRFAFINDFTFESGSAPENDL